MESGAPSDAAGAPRVLVCDDSEPIRRLLRVNLELEGFVVDEAADGAAALHLLRDDRRRPPAVVLLDAAMGPHGGDWTLCGIRADERLSHVPVILVTASTHVDDWTEALASGFDAFVAKPFDPDRVVALVSRLAGVASAPSDGF